MTSLEAAERLSSLLTRYRSFEECLLLSVDIVHFGYSADLVFAYLWDEAGKVLAVSEAPRVGLRLIGIREIHYVNEPPGDRLPELEDIGWGYSEVAIVKLGASSKEGILTLNVLWEQARRLDVSFQDFSAIDV